MNPYVYQPAHIQQQQQQYQYPTQYAQQQQYYYIQQQPSANQSYTAQQLANPYGTLAYQNPQTTATIGQYPFHYQTQQLQGYAQNAKAQQYAAANVHVAGASSVSSNYYPAVSQASYIQAFGAKESQSTATEQPPLPPEQDVSSAPPPLPPEPAPASSYSFPVSTSAATISVSLAPAGESTRPLTDAQKEYQEKFLQWQQQYAQWEAQHQNHPDKKQYQEWQKQMSQWQQQNQQLLQTHLGKPPLQSQQQQEEQQPQAAAGNVHQMSKLAVVQPQQQPGIYGAKPEAKVEYTYHSHMQLQQKQQPQPTQATQLSDSPIQNRQNVLQGYGFHAPLHQQTGQQQKPNWMQSQKDPNKQISQNQYQPALVPQKQQQYHVQQGHSFYSQNQVNQQEQELKPSWVQSQKDQNKQMSQNQYQSAVASQEEQNYHLQQGYDFHAQTQVNLPVKQETPSWLQTQAGQNNQSFQSQYQPTVGSKIQQQYYEQQGSDFYSQKLEQQQQQEEELKIPKWMQNQTGQNKQNSQNQNQSTATVQDHQEFQGLKQMKKQGTLNWMQNQQIQNKPNSENQHQVTGTTQDKGSLPSWMQSLPHKYVSTSQGEFQGSQRPNWLQSSKETTTGNEEKTDVTAAEDSNQVPKWLQQGLITGQSSTDGEVKEQRQVPKWLQGQVKTPEQPKTQDNQSPHKQLPKWLQEQPVSAGQSYEAEESQNQIPNWLKSKNTDQQDVSSRQTTPALHSRGNKLSKWDQDKRSLSGVAASVASVTPKKLNALEQLELLRQQQEQLQQLQKLESRLKHGSTSLPSATTAVAAAPRSAVITAKPPSARTPESWSQGSSAESQSAHIIKNTEKPAVLQGTQSPLAKVPCKFFPKCRFGSTCRFQHPFCKFGPRCQQDDCIFDHTGTAEKSEEHQQGDQEAKYCGDDYQRDVDADTEGLLPFSSGSGQIPGIADGELPVVPAEIPEEDNTDQQLGDEAEQDNSVWQDDSFQNSQGDYAATVADQGQDEKPKDVDQEGAQPPKEGLLPTPYQERTNEDEWKHAEHQWGAREEWDRAPVHHGEHSHSLLSPDWGKDRPHDDRDWPPYKVRLERKDEHHKARDERPPFTMEGRTPLPREGEGDKLCDRREPRAPFDRDERDFRPPVSRDEREFGPPFARHERERRPPFPGDERDRWPPFPPSERSRGDPFSRDERPPFMRDEYDRRPMWWDERETRPPLPRDERDRRDIAFFRDERDRPPFPRDDLERHPPFPRGERDGRPPIPRDERDERPPFPKDDLERKPPSRDGRDEEPKWVPPFDKDGMRDSRDSRPPFGRDEPFLRDERERRAPFLRGEREGRPPFPIEERDSRPPFPRDERGVPLSPPPREARDRWFPGQREEGDRREHHPAGRPLSPERFSGRRGEMLRERSAFDWDERGRLEWPPWDPHRRDRSPPGRDFRGRPPFPPEELDRFGRLLPLPSHGRWSDKELFDDERGRPPPRDWDRRDWRGPPLPEDQWRRSPPPPSHWDHGRDRFPPVRPKEWERPGYDRRGPEDFERRGPDDRYHEEHLPPSRRPPFEDYIRDRPPPFDDHPPRYDSPSFPPPHPEDTRHPAEGLRIEKKAETVPVESIFDSPGRESRPDRIVVILRGPPGSGKTHVARLLKDKEVSYGAHAPRILALDDYFLVEVEKLEQDSETGKKMKKKVTEYVYEAEMEEAYTANMFKSFTKTLEEGFFPVVIVDAIHDKVEQFEKYWSHAKQKGFEVYVSELMADAHACAKRNSHNRTFEEINKMVSAWEETPTHHLRLDVRSLLQDAVITEVEMEAADDTPAESTEQPEATKEAEEEEPEIQVPKRSKWEELDPAEDKLNKLDGIRPLKRRREESPPFALSDEDDPYDEREEDMRIGKKRVRWADLEEKKDLEHRRRIGFCIGTDWSLLTDPNAEIPRI